MHYEKNQDRQASRNGRLLARPMQPTGTAPVGLQPLGLCAKRDFLLYVPKNYQASRPAPLVVMLHGAGGDAADGMSPFLSSCRCGWSDPAGTCLARPDVGCAVWSLRTRYHKHRPSAGADVQPLRCRPHEDCDRGLLGRGFLCAKCWHHQR